MSELPQGWANTLVGEIAEIASGVGFPKHEQGKTHGDYPFAKVRDISYAVLNHHGLIKKAANYVDHDDLIRLRARPVPSGSTVFAKIGEALRLNRRALAQCEIILDNNCMAVVPEQELIDPSYLFRFFTTVDLSPFAVSTAVPSVRKGDVENIALPLPPLGEQRRIVAKLDSLFEHTGRAREELSHVPLLIGHYKQAILEKAFRGDLTADWRKDNPASNETLSNLEDTRRSTWSRLQDEGKLGKRYKSAVDFDWSPDVDLPEGWIFASVDQLVVMVQYGSSAKASETPEGVPVLRMGNIQDGELEFSSLKYLPEDHQEFPELLLDRGDILFNRTNSQELVGKTAVFHGEQDKVSFASYLIRLKACGMEPELLASYINSAYGRDWVASVVSQQVGQANVNGTKLRHLAVPVMPRDEQREIVSRVREAIASIRKIAADADAASVLLDHLDQANLSKAFRGELAPQDPDDEPAPVLLYRILEQRATQ